MHEFMNDSSRDPTQLFVCEMDYIGYAVGFRFAKKNQLIRVLCLSVGLLALFALESIKSHLSVNRNTLVVQYLIR